MMLIDIRKVEDCFDGSVIFEYFFDQKIDEVFMKELGHAGKLDYHPEFHRQFYKILTSDGLQIKGIIGENNLEITFPQTKKLEKKKNFENYLRQYLLKQIK